MTFSIGKVNFSNDRTVIIAEAGVNHLGRMDYAEQLVKTAARAGADIVKFQTYKANKLTTKDAPRFWDWKGEVNQEGTQYDSYSRLDTFGRDEHIELIKLCQKYDIQFMSTAFDNESVDMLVDIGAQGFKVASCDITNIPFLKHIANTNLPILLSTGASDINDIKRAVSAIEEEGNNNIAIMHCTLCYPTDPKDSNLSAINDIRLHFPDYILGLSDHTLGTLIPSASILMGVRIIEKHYTFDKTLPESADHWLSLDEEELTKLINDVRTLESSIGINKKICLECEESTFKYARRSIVAREKINKGDVITEDHLIMKRPGTGIPPYDMHQIINKKANKDIEEDTLLSIDDLE